MAVAVQGGPPSRQLDTVSGVPLGVPSPAAPGTAVWPPPWLYMEPAELLQLLKPGVGSAGLAGVQGPGGSSAVQAEPPPHGGTV